MNKGVKLACCVLSLGLLAACNKPDVTVEVIDPGVQQVSGIQIAEQGKGSVDSSSIDPNEFEDFEGAGEAEDLADLYIEVADAPDQDLLELLKQPVNNSDEPRSFLTEPKNRQQEIRYSLRQAFMNNSSVVTGVESEGTSNLALYNDGRFAFIFSSDLWDVVGEDVLALDPEKASTSPTDEVSSDGVPSENQSAVYQVGLVGKGDKKDANAITFSVKEGVTNLTDMARSLYSQLETMGITNLNVVVDEVSETIAGVGLLHNPESNTDCIASVMSGGYEGYQYLLLSLTDIADEVYSLDIERILTTFVPM